TTIRRCDHAAHPRRLPRRRTRRGATGDASLEDRAMIGSTRNLRVLAYPAPADLRKGYNGLSGLVCQGLGKDPLSGDCYLFVNRKRDAAKVLMWDGTGLCIFQKRLEHGRFAAL